MKKCILITLSAFAILLGIYLGFKGWSTHQANQDTDAFFSKFRESQGSMSSDDFKFLSQDHSEARSILSRNSEAIYNFSYEATKPELNLALNDADIEVSWHLKSDSKSIQDIGFLYISTSIPPIQRKKPNKALQPTPSSYAAVLF